MSVTFVERRMGDRGTIKEVFNQCQTGMQGHGKLMKTLHKIYDKTEFPTFWSEFSHYLRYAMIVFKREPAVERVIDFVSNFVTSLCKKSTEKGDDSADEGTEEEEDSVADNKLLQEMFDFLLNSHSAKDRGVRFRCCQLVNKLLTNLGEEAQIDDDLYDRLYECMLERLKDKCPVVRYHAVMAMTRLQDPSDENCPVIKAFLFLLNCDPNPDVRRAVLAAIAPSSKTLASIIDRTRDVKDTVRKTAYEVLAEKIHIKAMSIALRLQLANEGLKDRAESVKQACSGKLLQSWMRTLNGNILELLKSLDVEDSTDVCTSVLETLFKASTVPDLIERFDILNEHILVPDEMLTSESALYWQVICKYIHAMGTDGDEYMEKVMPTVVDFCAFMQRYIDTLKTIDDPEIQLGREFIIEQLLLMTSYMDTADAASKKALETLFHNMLMADYVSHRLVKSVVARICAVRGTGDTLVPYFAETVSEIREPITVVEKDVETEQKRQINLKIASIRVQLNQCREDLETAVREQNFERAGELKNTIAQLDAEKIQLLETSEPVREEIRTEKNDPLTLLKCQTIISEMLQLLKVNTVSATLQMMIESQIVPGIQNEDADVRNMAMQTLGLCCYHSKDLLVTYIPLFMQASQIDVEEVRVTALRVLFDLLLIYGLEIIDASESSTDSSDDQQDGDTLDSTTTDTISRGSDTRAGVGSKLVAIICSFLDGESSELRTCAAEGLCKLLLTGRVVSSKILSHLILLWYNPLSEDDTHLRDCLGTYFPLYALASRSNQEVVEEAFLPTLRTLLNAPASSPLAEVDVNNVAELLVQLTNTKLLTANRTENDATLDNPGHDNLSERVCNEILSGPESSHLKLWVRILNQMEVSPDNEVVLKDLRVLAYKMVKLVKEKMSLKGLQKFQERINKLAEKFISENDDIENMIVEQVENEVVEEESIQDSTLQTPKRKRIRGLYSQNMTLAMDSETELDIAGDPMVEVDASCLMSRSTSDTPSRPRARKNTTTTELAEEEVGNVMQTTSTSSEHQITSTSIDDDKNVTETTEDQTLDDVSSSQSQSSENTSDDGEDKSNKQSKSPERRGRSAEKKSSSPKKGDKKSPVKNQDKHKASKSPVKNQEIHKASKSPAKNQEKRKASKSPASPSSKRVASESPVKKSQEKRKASQSPSRERKRMSKSPSRSASTARKGSKSPDKKSSKSPIREQSSTKSPVKSGDSKGSASPVKRKSLSSPPAKSPQKKKSASDKNSADDKSPQKKKSVSDSNSADEKKKSPKSPAKSSKERNAKPVPEKSSGSNVRNARSATRTGSQLPLKNPSGTRKRGPNSPVVALSKLNTASKKSQSTVGKTDTTVRKDIRTTTRVAENSAQRVSARTVKSPVQGKDRSAKATASSKSKTNEIVGASKVSARNSPRLGRAADQTVADTPEPVVRRSSGRSVASSPSVGTPRSQGSDISVPETPENDNNVKPSKKTDTLKSGQKATVRTAGRTPDVSSSGLRSSRLRGTPSTVTPTTNTRKPTKRTAASTSSSTSDSSPEKPATKTSRYARGKVVGSESSTPGSASSSRSTKAKPASSKASPVKNLSKELKIVSDDDDEEDSLRRRAKPSRRSNTATSSTLMSPQVTGRATRASSQSSIDSPTVESPSSQRAASRRNKKGLVESSQETISLISSQKSSTSSTSAKSQSSAATKKTNDSRSKSTSSSMSAKATKPVDSKVTRSAIPTRPSRTQPGQLKRPTRTASRSSDRK